MRKLIALMICVMVLFTMGATAFAGSSSTGNESQQKNKEVGLPSLSEVHPLLKTMGDFFRSISSALSG